MRIRIWLQATRPQFFVVIMLPVFLGSAVAWYDNKIFSLYYFALALFAGILCAAAANVLNDYFDHLNHSDIFNTDPLTPFAGGSRMIQNGILRAKQMRNYGIILLILAVTLGMFLVWARGTPLLWIGFIGILSAYFYSAPPSLHHLGLGEITIALNYGILAVAGAYFVQTQTYSITAFFASLPMAGLAMAILYMNQFPDFEADRAAGKKNWVVRLGRERARRYFNYMILGSFSVILLGIGLQQLPILTGLAGFALPLGFKAMRILQKSYQQKHELIPAIQATIVLHSVVSWWLIFAFLLS